MKWWDEVTVGCDPSNGEDHTASVVGIKTIDGMEMIATFDREITDLQVKHDRIICKTDDNIWHIVGVSRG